MKFFCFLILVFSRKVFASDKSLPIGTFPGINFSLEKNGVIILSDEDFNYHNSTLQIKKITSHIYEFIITAYLQKTHNSKALSDIRVDKYKILWESKTMGALINVKKEHNKDIVEFLLSADKLIIKSLASNSSVIETHSYKIE
jgi:hypothetical protein